FGKRWSRGQLLQVGAQQFATADPRGADGDQLALFARVGWAAGEWSVDGFASTTSRTRNVMPRLLDDRAPLPPLDARRDLYYLRAGYGNPDLAGPWVQLVAAIQRFRETSENPTTIPELPVDTVDTLARRSQFLASAGFTRGAARLGATVRVRAFDGETYLSPGARAEWTQGIVAASAYVERAADDSTLRADVQLRVSPLPFVTLLGVASHHSPFGDDGRDSEQSFRAEAGVRVGRTWLSGGMMARGSALTPAPLAFDTGLAAVTREATGLFGQIRGPVWRDVSVSVTGVMWGDDDAGAGYVPRRQLRSEATLDTRWLSRFPSGHFGLRASIVHDWRDVVLFPLTDGTTSAVPASSVLDGLLEIRILDGVIWLQARNMTAVTWASTPGFVQPATTLLYGVRWQFWN
ncbi:MAG TPA: hypothetical protein VFY16_05900, partial [Gemmatimonadaceae bacterium]|nr:hypothetical protein [Gemmatimonadaceae bacterium]